VVVKAPELTVPLWSWLEELPGTDVKGVSPWAGTSDLLLPVLGQEGNKKEGEGGFEKSKSGSGKRWGEMREGGTS
jgi:hypothetical protein